MDIFEISGVDIWLIHNYSTHWLINGKYKTKGSLFPNILFSYFQKREIEKKFNKKTEVGSRKTEERSRKTVVEI
jgi:hypothetical protein